MKNTVNTVNERSPSKDDKFHPKRIGHSNQNSFSLYVDDNIGNTDESVKEITSLMKKIIDEA